MQCSETTGKLVSSGGDPGSQLAREPRLRSTSRWLLLGGWLLMMPPIPVGTELPPLSEWSPLAVYETAEQCESKGEEVRNAARRMITSDPNAGATTLAAAMGQVQATCVEDDSVEPPAKRGSSTGPPDKPEPKPAPGSAAKPKPPEGAEPPQPE